MNMIPHIIRFDVRRLRWHLAALWVLCIIPAAVGIAIVVTPENEQLWRFLYGDWWAFPSLAQWLMLGWVAMSLFLKPRPGRMRDFFSGRAVPVRTVLAARLVFLVTLGVCPFYLGRLILVFCWGANAHEMLVWGASLLPMVLAPATLVGMIAALATSQKNHSAVSSKIVFAVVFLIFGLTLLKLLTKATKGFKLVLPGGETLALILFCFALLCSCVCFVYIMARMYAGSRGGIYESVWVLAGVMLLICGWTAPRVMQSAWEGHALPPEFHPKPIELELEARTSFITEIVRSNGRSTYENSTWPPSPDLGSTIWSIHVPMVINNIPLPLMATVRPLHASWKADKTRLSFQAEDWPDPVRYLPNPDEDVLNNLVNAGSTGTNSVKQMTTRCWLMMATREEMDAVVGVSGDYQGVFEVHFTQYEIQTKITAAGETIARHGSSRSSVVIDPRTKSVRSFQINVAQPWRNGHSSWDNKYFWLSRDGILLHEVGRSSQSKAHLFGVLQRTQATSEFRERDNAIPMTEEFSVVTVLPVYVGSHTVKASVKDLQLIRPKNPSK